MDLRDWSQMRMRSRISLLFCPIRREPVVDEDDLNFDEDAATFLFVRDALFPYLRHRRWDEEEARAARQALTHVREIQTTRHADTGYVFSWQGQGVIYYLAIRETDALTRRLDPARAAHDEAERHEQLRSRRPRRAS